MAEKRILRHSAQTEKKEKKNGRFAKFLKALSGIVILTAVIFGGAYLYKTYAPQNNDENGGNDVYYMPAQTVETVAFKNSFVINTIDGIRITNKKGEDINDDVVNSVSPYVKGMKTPKMHSNGKTVLIFDTAGKSAVLFNEAGIIQTYSFSGDIISGKMNEQGQFVFAVQDSGSKAAVKVYSEAGAELFTWFSGKGYVTDAMLNNSKNRLAVVTNESIEGAITSKILIFTLDNPEPIIGKTIGNTLCSSVSYYKDSVFAVCDDGLYFMDKDGNLNNIYDFSGKKMKHFKTFTNGNALLLSESAAKEKYDAVVINTNGKKISEFTVDSFLKISDIGKNNFLIIKRKGVMSVSKKGKIKNEIPCEFEVKDAKYFGGKTAVVSQDKIIFE